MPPAENGVRQRVRATIRIQGPVAEAAVDGIPRLVRADPQVVGVEVAFLDLLHDLGHRVLVIRVGDCQQTTLLIPGEREVVCEHGCEFTGGRVVTSLLVATTRLRPDGENPAARNSE